MLKCLSCLIAGAVAGWVLGAAGSAFGDTIVLKSGDSFSGTITAVHPDTVDVTTPFAGAIHVRRDTIKSLRSDGQVNITVADGTSHNAFVSPLPDGSGWRETAAAVPPPAVATVQVPAPPPVAKAPEKAIELNLEPYFLPVGPDWKDEFSVGAVNTTGNTSSTSFTSELDMHYKVNPQELSLKIGGVYEQTNGTQTAGQFYFDAVYRRSVPEWDKSERWYVFGENHELYDAIKAISVRSTSGGGVGYYLFKGDKFSADLRAGPAYVYERFFSGDSNSDVSGLAGLRIQYAINDRASLSQNVLYTTAFSNASRYQLTSESALNLKLPEIARGVGMKFAFVDDYDNTAAPPVKNNDTRLTLSLTLDF